IAEPGAQRAEKSIAGMKIIEYVRMRRRPKGRVRQTCHRDIDVTETDIVEIAFDADNEAVELPVVPDLAPAGESRLVGAGGKQRSAGKFAEKKTCGLFRDFIVERPARVEPDIKSGPAKDRRGWWRRRSLSRHIGSQNWRSDQTSDGNNAGCQLFHGSPPRRCRLTYRSRGEGLLPCHIQRESLPPDQQRAV